MKTYKCIGGLKNGSCGALWTETPTGDAIKSEDSEQPCFGVSLTPEAKQRLIELGHLEEVA